MIQPERQPTRLAPGEIDPVQPIDPTHPLTRGLEGLWLPLPRTTGGSRLYDLSGKGRHGDLTNMDSTTDWVYSPETVAPGLDFDGTDDFTSHGTINPLGGASAFTHEIVFLKPSTTSNFESITRDEGTLNLQFRSGKFGGTQGEPAIGYFVDGGLRSYEVDQDLADNAIHHLSIALRPTDEQVPTAVVDGQEVSMTLVEDNTSGTGPLDTNSNDFRIAAAEDGSEYYAGQVWLHALRSVKLSVAQQEHLYSQWRRGMPDLLRRRDQSALYVSGAGAITASITEGAQAGDSMNATARLTAAMTEAAQSGDTLGSTGQLVEALTEGAQSGETWASTLLAAASVDEGAVSSEDFVATVIGGIQASLNEGSTAAESFVDALIARASFAEGATAAEDFVDALIAGADVEEGAMAGESLSATVSTPALTAAISEAAKAGDSWAATSTLAASISEGAQATDDMTPITAARWLEATIRVAAKLAGSADTDSTLDGTPNIDPND